MQNVEKKLNVIEINENKDAVQIAVAPAKDWSNPSPAGLVALAVACSCFFALLTGRVEASAMPLLGCWLLGGFVVQLVVALLDLKSGNGTGGNTFLFFSAFFMLAGGLEMFNKYNGIVLGAPLDGRIDGYAWAVLAAVIILWTPAFFAKFSLLSLIVLALDVACPVIALTDLGLIDKSFSHIAGWALLIGGIIGIYLSAAIVVNTAFGKKKLPLP